MVDTAIEAEIKKFLWRVFRHKFASRLQMKCAPVENGADFWGHESLTMTRRYTHLGLCKIPTVVSFSSAAQLTPQVTPAKSV